FGSIAGGLDHVNPVIRLPIEHGISSGTRDCNIDHEGLPAAIAAVIGTTHAAQHPSVPTPLKLYEEAKKIRVDIEDSDTEASGDSGKGAGKAKAACVSDKKKKKRLEIKDCDAEVSYGSAQGTSKDKGGSHFDKKKHKRVLNFNFLSSRSIISTVLDKQRVLSLDLNPMAMQIEYRRHFFRFDT
ncbi:hypothetical protein Tco_0972624, partial [Tanacetum coccineum]